MLLMMTKTEDQKKAYLYALVAVLFWSTIASAFKISLRYLPVLPLVLYASVASTSVLFAYLLWQERLALLKALSGRDYVRSALLGFLNPFVYYLIMIKAYSMLRAQEAMTINWSWPMTLVLLSIPLLHQRIKVRSILAIIISFAGVFIIATQGHIFGFRFSNPVGVMLALVSTLIWALFWIYNARDERDEAVRLFLNFAFGSAYAFAAFLFMLPFTGTVMPHCKGILGAVYVGLFEMGVTFLVWLKALRLAKTTAHVANLIFLAPFLSLVLISLVVGEKIFLSTVIGLVFIVTGIILQRLWS
jgi:drug/metabolite transporter (DMT)-like permease